MQRPLRLLAVLLLSTCFAAPAAAERLGLVVGIDKYDSLAPLKNAVADAIAATLRTTGFTVPKEWVLKNPGKRAMDDAINALAGSTKPGDEVFLYFSGHGVQIGATPLMMPADVRDPVRRADGQMRSHESNRDVYEATEQVKSDGISLQAVANKIAERGPRLSLLVIDACRDNPVIELLREAQRYGKNMGGGATTGFDAIEKGENQIVIFAAGKGERALDRLGGADTERNSVFARVLLKKMRTPGLELRKLYGEVKDEVPRLASQYKDPATGAPHRQKPVALAGYGVPDFYFIQVPVNVTVNQGATDPLAVELAFWNSVKDSGKTEELKLYLERYPQGQFAALARGRAKSLEGVAREREEARRQAEERQRLEKQQRDMAMFLIRGISIHVENTQNILGIDLNLAVIQEQAERLVSVMENISDLSSYHAELKYLDFLYDQFNDMATNWTKKYEKRARKFDRADTVEAKTRSDEVIEVFNDFLKKLGQPEILSPAKSFKAGQIIKDCAECPEMVVIPGGSFEMGSNDGYSKEKPVRSVRIAQAFALGKSEVTQGQWKALMGSNPSHFSACGDDCPVEQVSWDDAQAYIKKLNEKTGKGYRLPSEAEWEYAARAGTRTAYSTGDCIHTNQANYDGNYDYKDCGAKTGVYRKTTMKVGSFAPNAFGLHDMHGNVREWVEDCYHDSYQGAPTDGSVWASGCTEDRRVLRGGSWNGNPQVARSADRYGDSREDRSIFFGFRVARMLP